MAQNNENEEFELSADVPAAMPRTLDEQALISFMELNIWPGVPQSASRRWSKEEEEGALGYGQFGEAC